MVHLSPAMRSVEPYPFEELDRRTAAARARGRTLIDFGVGDPREVTPAFIRDALKDALEPVSSYPRAAGLPVLREAVCAWVDRRFGVGLDPDLDVLPILGSKELVFRLAQLVLDPAAGRDLVVVTAPGYPIPERGARWAGGDVLRLPLRESERLPGRPRRGGRPGVGAHGAAVAQLPEQPHRGRGAARVLPAGGRARAPPRVPAGLRRGLQRAVVRRRAARRACSRWATSRTSWPSTRCRSGPR